MYVEHLRGFFLPLFVGIAPLDLGMTSSPRIQCTRLRPCNPDKQRSNKVDSHRRHAVGCSGKVLRFVFVLSI